MLGQRFFFYRSLANLSNVCVKFKPLSEITVHPFDNLRPKFAGERGDPRFGFVFTWRKVNVQIGRRKHICQINFGVPNIELMVVGIFVVCPLRVVACLVATDTCGLMRKPKYSSESHAWKNIIFLSLPSRTVPGQLLVWNLYRVVVHCLYRQL